MFAKRFSRASSLPWAALLVLPGLLVAGCAADRASQSVDAADAHSLHASGAHHMVTLYPAMPVAVSSFGAAASDGYLYVFGGHQTRTHDYHTQTTSPQFHRLNLVKPTTWERLPDGPGVQGMNLVADGAGHIYRIGGMNPRNAQGDKAANYSTASAAKFNVAKGKWEALPDLPQPRSSHDMVVIGQTLYVLGGWNMNAVDGNTWHEQGLTLDLSKADATWQPFEQPFVRRALVTAVHAGKLYVIGGMDADNDITLGVDIYDPRTGQWSQGPELPGSKFNGFSAAACQHENRLYVSVFDGSLLRLDEKSQTWKTIAATTPRIVHRMVSAGGDLLILGGADKSGAVYDLIETVTLSPHGVFINGKPSAEQEAAEVKTSIAPVTPAKPVAALQAVCPVMTDAQVGSRNDQIVTYRGQEVRLCCEACLSRWEKNPDNYAIAAFLPQLVGADVPPRAIEQVFCPVYKTRVVSPEDPFVMYEGQKVYLYNQAAVKKWQADPEKYADPKLLPQLVKK